MESTRLSTLLHHAFAAAVRDGALYEPAVRAVQALEPALAQRCLEDLPRLAGDPSTSLEVQDELLAAVIRCYRRRRSPWSAVLLAMLSPALVEWCSHACPQPGTVSTEDIQQQLVAEVLTVATAIPLPEPSRYMQWRVVLRTSTRMARWLAVELRRDGHRRASRAVEDAGKASQSQEGPEDEVGLAEGPQTRITGPPHEDGEGFLLAELAGGMSGSDLALLYRHHVLGEAVPDLARELGTTEQHVYNSQRRAERRLRRHVA